MKIRTTCIKCGDNFKIIDEFGKCRCGGFVREIVDCEICKYSHKVRAPEFCRALQSSEGLDSIDTNLFLKQTKELQKNAKS